MGLDDPKRIQRKIHSHELKYNRGVDLIVIRAMSVTELYPSLLYPSPLKSTDDVPETVAKVRHGGMYVWDTIAMKGEVDEEIVETWFLDVRPLKYKKRSQRRNDDDASNVSDEFDIGTGVEIYLRT